MEAGLQVANVDDAGSVSTSRSIEPPGSRAGDVLEDRRPGRASTTCSPRLALVFDNSLCGLRRAVLAGAGPRFEISQTIGGLEVLPVPADYRRYDQIVGPFILATRGLFFGRIGRDANQFQLFSASTDLLRGNTSGSYQRNECRDAADPGNSDTGCAVAGPPDRHPLAVGNAELRFPLLTRQIFRGSRPASPDRGRALLRRRPGVERRQHAQVEPRQPGDDPETVRYAARRPGAPRSGPTCSASLSCGSTTRSAASTGRSRASGP